MPPLNVLLGCWLQPLSSVQGAHACVCVRVLLCVCVYVCNSINLWSAQQAYDDDCMQGVKAGMQWCMQGCMLWECS